MPCVTRYLLGLTVIFLLAFLMFFGNAEIFVSTLQMSLMVAKDAELHKSKLQFFMEQFYGIIRRMDSSSKELSIAIRGYGLFAAVRAGN